MTIDYQFGDFGAHGAAVRGPGRVAGSLRRRQPGRRALAKELHHG
jgi:hypothetical protein